MSRPSYGMTPRGASIDGLDTPVSALFSPTPSKDPRSPGTTPGVSSMGSPSNENSPGNVLSPVPRGMDASFYSQNFAAADPGRLVTEIEGRQAGDPHGTTAAYRHLVKVLVKKLGTKPDTVAVKTAEKRQVERARDNALLEVEAQQNTIAHLKAELTERREHERLNQHSIALLDSKLGEKVREALFMSNELDALRRHNQALVDTKTGLESQLETGHSRLVERSTYVVELEAKVEDLSAKLQAERRSRNADAAAAASEHGADQQALAELNATVDAMRRSLSQTEGQLAAWEASDPKVAVSAHLDGLVRAAQDEAAAAEARAVAAEKLAAAAAAKATVKPSLEMVMVLAVAAWPMLIAMLVSFAFYAYGSADPGTATRAFAAVAAEAEAAAVAAAAAAADLAASEAAAAAAAEFEAAFASDAAAMMAEAAAGI